MTVLASLSVASPIKIVTTDFPPYSYLIDGNPSGMATEVVLAILKDLGMNTKIEYYPWARAYKMATYEKNILIYTLAGTPQRENIFHFIGEISTRVSYFLKLKSRKDIKIESVNDLKQYSIGVVRDYATDKQLITMGLENNLQRVGNDIQNIAKLFMGRIDLFPIDELIVAYHIRLHNKGARKTKQAYFEFTKLEKVFKLPNQGQGRMLAFSFNTSPEIVKIFKDSFQRIKRKGIIESIRNKYLH